MGWRARERERERERERATYKELQVLLPEVKVQAVVCYSSLIESVNESGVLLG